MNPSMNHIVNDRNIDSIIVLTETVHKKTRGEPSYLYRKRHIPVQRKGKKPVKPKGKKQRVKNVSKM